jgi:NACHT domain
MSVRLSKPGPLREGFEFQDLYGVHLALSWLEHPSDYRWLRFEAQEFGWLDDLAALTTDGDLILIQIKHVTERPDRPEFTLDDFINAEGTKKSLFQKWFISWIEAVRNPEFRSVRPSLYTNRPTAADLRSICIGPDPLHIDPDILRGKYLEAYRRMLEQAGTDSAKLNEFLTVFFFQFDRADIEPSEQALTSRAEALNISREGFSSLRDQVWHWATKRGPDGETIQIGIDDLKRACGWRMLEALNEDFPIAEDYVPLGGNLVETFARVIIEGDAADFVLADVPGAGKSTFLAKLAQHFLEHRIPCVRHHYYLGVSDRSMYERVRSGRTADALMAELAAYSTATVNPSQEKLRQILTTTARNLKAQGLRLVVILDGLDHVLRTEDADELGTVLKQLLPPPDNCSIVLGTRLIPIPAVSALLSHIPPRRRLTVPRLIHEDCVAMMGSHRNLQISEHDTNSLAARLLRITEGLPLHAHYSLVQLEILGEGRYLRDTVFDQLIPYGGDLETYYDAIWDPLTAETKVLAVLFAIADFAIPRRALSELFHGSAPELQRGYEQLRPFINESDSGISLFHASFQEFISAHRDAEIYRIISLQRLISWLSGPSAPLDLRWRWLDVKKYEADDPEPLIQGTTRDWAVASILDGQDPDEVQTLLRLAAHAAMEKDDYPCALQRAMLADYIENGCRFHDDLWAEIVSLVRLFQLDGARQGAHQPLDVISETDEVLLEEAKHADGETLTEIGGEFYERLRGVVRERELHNYKNEVATAAEHYISVLAIARTPAKEVLELLGRFSSDLRSSLYEHYVGALVETTQPFNALSVVNASDISASGKPRLLEKVARSLVLAAPANTYVGLGPGPWAQMYRYLIQKEAINIHCEWPSADDFPDTIPRFTDEQQARLSEVYVRTWLLSCLAGVTRQRTSLDNWLSGLPTHCWTARTARVVAEFGWLSGSDLLGDGLDVCAHCVRLSEVEEITPGDPSWDDWELWKSYKAALQTILIDLLSLRATYQKRRLDDAAFAALQQIRALTEYDLYRLLLACRSDLLERIPLENFVNYRLQGLKTRLDTFPERAQAYMEVAQLTRRGGAPQLSRRALAGAVSNALGYGYHKDMFLYEVIHAMIYAAPHHLVGAESLIDRIAPIANVIDRVTDKDETGNLLEDFAELCTQSGRTASVAAIYSSVLRDERYYLAEDVFSTIAKSGDLDSIWNRSLVSTVIDRRSRSQLKKRAQKEPFAEEVVERLRATDHDPLFSPADDTKTEAKPESGPILESLNERLWEVHPPDQIPPEQFIAFIDAHKGDFRLDEFCKRWWAHWKQQDRSRAYEALYQVLNRANIRLFGGDLQLDILPDVLEREDPAQAFDFLVRAARGLHVWNSFYTQPEKVERAFSVLLQHFPDRLNEFLGKTVESAGYRRQMSALPVRRGVELLVMARRYESALELLEAAVRILETLMADLQLPLVDWPASEDKIIDCLFTRLLHVHPEIRSRAASEIGRLLTDAVSQDRTRREITERLAKCELESEALVLLYPIAWARQRGLEWSIENLKTNLTLRSSAIDLMLEGMGS